MSKLKERYRAIISDRAFYLQLMTGLLLFAFSLFFNFFANNYTANKGVSSVSDLILDHLPVVNVEIIFLEGFITFIALIALLAFQKPARIPFILKAAALFITIRAFFIILTHLAPPQHEIIFHSENALEHLISGSGDDLFFSGHTGFPFLMALAFWQNKFLRTLFLAAAIFFGCAVLLGHLHYSIDVFSAFFISYGIFHIAIIFFERDYKMFLQA